jgi:Cof subfamily protein (haloacid dehalogenase superfamily)
MNKFYISDLDGTLLAEDGTLSEFSRRNLCRLLDRGLPFTVASARSVVTIREKLRGVPLRFPVIEFNGAFLSDYETGEHRFVNDIEKAILEDIPLLARKYGCHPHFSTFDGRQDCVYIPTVANPGIEWYLNDRLSARDPRLKEPKSFAEIIEERVVCVTVIDELRALEGLRRDIEAAFPDRVQVHLFENTYSPRWFWLTIHDRNATKARAAEILMEEYGIEREGLVVFGDNSNDLSLFDLASRRVAVANATPELIERATEVIGSNEDNSVVKYLVENWRGPD